VRVLSVGNRYPPEGFGGYEALWQDTVRWLRGRGHEVTVLACDLPAPGVDEPDVRRELPWYWRDHAFPRRSPRERWKIERRSRVTIERVIAETRAEAVAWFSMGGMSLSPIERTALPAIGVVGDEWLAYGPKVDGWLRMTRRRFTGGGVLWIFISRALLARTQQYGAEPAETLIAHPGVDPAAFPVADAHAWTGDLLYAGRIDPRKGIATAVEALAALPGARLTVDGGGDEAHAQELRVLAARLGVAVSFERTPRAALAARYGAADALLHPVTWQEPWGLAPLEAMACGTPVVATGTGGSGEYLRDGANALLFEPGDAASLAAAVARLRDDPALRARLRAGGVETAAAFTSEAFFAAVERALVVRVSSLASGVR
jgi:glycosyltransferase involved in cell wall biosynthesis